MSQNLPSLRFAVLHHTGVADEHYDLLIETAGDAPLRTWRCEHWPLEREAVLIKLPDHRRAYLDYEGPISGGRGEVSRVDAGVCELELNGPDNLRCRLRRPTGDLHLDLAQARDDRWLARVR